MSQESRVFENDKAQGNREILPLKSISSKRNPHLLGHDKASEIETTIPKGQCGLIIDKHEWDNTTSIRMR